MQVVACCEQDGDYLSPFHFLFVLRMNMVIFLKIAVELDKAFVKGKKEPTNEGDEMGT